MVISWNWVSRLSARASAFSEYDRAITPGWPGVNRVGTLITHLVILHSHWSSGSRDSIVALRWSFLRSLSRRVTVLCRRLNSALRARSLVTCRCLCSRFFRRISSWMPADIGGHHAGDSWEWKLLELSERHQIRSQRTCRLPSLYVIPGWTESWLPGGTGVWPSQCTRNQGDPVGAERMSDT